MVEEVLFRDEIYNGDFADALPDLFVKWNLSAPIVAIRSGKIGEIRQPLPYCRTGDHNDHAVAYALGPGVGPTMNSSVVRAFDLVPTVGQMPGVEFEGIGPTGGAIAGHRR